MKRDKRIKSYAAGVTLLLGLFSFILTFGQSSAKLTREGNNLYNSGKFNDAEIKYRKSLAAEKDNPTAGYNLGNTFYKQEKFGESANQYNTVLGQKNLSDNQKSALYHNLGTSLLKDKKYEESISAFKQSLKLNPKDNDTRYNLAYAQSMLRQQQQQQQQSKDNKNQDNKDQQKNDKQQSDQQKKDQQQQQQQQESAQDQKDGKGQKQQGSKKEISKEDAEKILQALNNDEKNLQKKLIRKEGTRAPVDKNW